MFDPVVRNGTSDEPAPLLVLIVSYNSADILPGLLAALPDSLRGIEHRVVVVDNDSKDGTLDVPELRSSSISVIPMGRNAGYAAAINKGVAHMPGRGHTLILNPDVRPAPGSVTALVRMLEHYPGTGIVVPRIVDDAGHLKFSLRHEPTLLRALGEAVLGGRRAARWHRWGEEIRDPRLYTDGRVADWATGAALLVSAECAGLVGAWDESFFLYSEETDFALRAGDEGFALRYCRSAVFGHPGGQMSRSTFLWGLVARNRVRLYEKRHGLVASRAYWLVVVLNEALRAAAGRPTHRAALRVLMRRATWP